MGALTEYSGYLETIPRDDFELSAQVEQGAPLESIDELRRNGLNFTEVAELVIPPRTLKHRRSRQQRLSVEETERLLRVVRLIAFADRVFGNHEKALRWLRGPDDRLQNATPLSLLRTEVGGRAVEGLLWGLSENIYQ